MKKTINLILILTLLIGKVFAQSTEVQNLVNQGVTLYEKGDYKGAIEQYQKALELDNKSPLANYEMASAYFAMAEYEKAITHSDRVIDAKSDFMDLAYVLKGSALDQLNKSEDAIKVYKKGIKAFPRNYLLHYNLALTYYTIKNFKEAEESLQNALQIKPLHSSSHLLLGYVMKEQGNRVKSLLALYNFLLIEPTGKRAAGAYTLLQNLLNKGISKESEKKINITLPNTNETDEFRSAELMMSLLVASKNTEKNKDKTEAELFAYNTNLFFGMLGDMRKKNKGFWWDYYVEFFNTMSKENHVEAFCYYISQSKGDEKIGTWLADNKSKVDALSSWVVAYKR